MKSHPKSPVKRPRSLSRESLGAEAEQLIQIWPLTERALSQFDDELLYQAWSRNTALSGNLKERIGELLEGSQKNKSSHREERAREELGCLQNFLQISKYLFDFMKEIREKIDRDIIFSPRAYGQLIGLWQTTFEVFQQAVNLLDSGKIENRKALSLQCAEITNLIIEYDLEHEDRLIRGICPKNASSVFLNMLDSIRGIIRSLNSIADLY